MNDLEKFKAMLQGKVQFKISENIDSKDQKFMPKAYTQITIPNSNAPDNVHLGYGNFYSEWFFDKDGNFIGVGHWA